MKRALCLSAALLLFHGAFAAAADFELAADRPEAVSVRFRDHELISRLTFRDGGRACLAEAGVERRRTALPGDAEAVNFLQVGGRLPFRLEVGLLRGGDELEIGFAAATDAYHPANGGAVKEFAIHLPFAAVDGMRYEALTGRSTRTRRQQGVIDAAFKGIPDARFLALSDGNGREIAFDLAPAGVANYVAANHIRSTWSIRREGDELLLAAPLALPFYGAALLAKAKVFAGTFGDYRHRHAARQYTYYDPPPVVRRYAFGAPKAGQGYRAAGKRPYPAAGNFGWLDRFAPELVSAAPEGMFYSAAAGRGRAVFRVADLEPGVYLATVGVGNYAGWPNRFRLAVNGRVLADHRTVPRRQAAVFTLPLWIESGAADLELTGDWLLSSFALQLLLHAHEDFSFRRGFFLANGWEPETLFRAENYAKEPEFRAAADTFSLPPPGAEAAGPRKEPAEPVALPDPDAPELAWRYSGSISTLGPGNNGTFYEFAAPGKLERRLDELAAAGTNIILVNGLLSRHTYPGHLGRAEREIARIVAEGRARGFKVLDHQDFSLLWNADSGFRVLTESTPYLQRSLTGHLPSTALCLSNPEYKKRYFARQLDFIRATGIDGIMIDEVNFGGADFCGCGHCRRAFFRDTGLHLPVNELSPELRNPASPLWRQWIEWRARRIGDWWVDFRRAVAAVRPDFVIMKYTTHSGFAGPVANHRYGGDLTQSARSVDFLGTEIMSRNVYRAARAVLSYRRLKNSLRHAYGAPVFGLVYPGGDDRSVAYFGWALNDMNLQSTWEIIGRAAPTAGGGDYRSFSGGPDRRLAAPAAEVALLFSNRTRNHGGTGNQWVQPFLRRLLGLAQTLDAMHVPYVVIGDFGLTEKALADIKVLFLAGADLMTDAEIALVRRFAQRGGAVVVDGFTGGGYGLGDRRARWPFAELFGLAPAGPPAPRRLAAAAATGQPLAGRANPAVRTVLAFDDGVPALLAAPDGAGTVWFFNADFATPLFEPEYTVGATYGFAPDQVAERCFREQLRAIVGAAAIWSAELPDRVFTSLHRQGRQWIVHLLNNTGNTVRPGDVLKNGVPDPAFPPLADDLRFTGRFGRVTRAYAVSPDWPGEAELEFEALPDGRCRVTLPKERFRVYTLVYLGTE